MNESSDGRIILCQPDNLKGCSICCGLFNFRDVSRGSLSLFLEQGRLREKNCSTQEEFQNTGVSRDRFAHICPYQGFFSPGRPGCLIHPLSSGVEGRNRSLFASKICNEFFCPAHTLLNDDEKHFLIKNVSDWYRYSAALCDPESYSFIYGYVMENYAFHTGEELLVSERAAVLVNAGLDAHARNLALYEGVIFYYSIPEYNSNKKNFCIRYIDEMRDLVVSHILESESVLK